MNSTPDPDPTVDAILTRVLERTPAGPADAAGSEKAGALHWLRSTLGVELSALVPWRVREPAPPYVDEAFGRVFDMMRRALGAREEDFALGNAHLRRDREGVQLEYRWREDSEEMARCSCKGKSLSVRRHDYPEGVRHAIRKRIHVERDGTTISASDDRENRQIREADCEAALEVFEAACRMVAPGDEGEAAPEDESP